MSPEIKSYVRLPGQSNTEDGGPWFQRYRAYLGPDHLLVVRNSRYAEQYQRFYFEDIQSIAVCETASSVMYTTFYGSGVIAAALMMIVFSFTELDAAPGGLVIFGVAAGICLVGLFLNVIFGRTVKCWIRTPRNLVAVPSVGRYGSARRFFSQLERAIINVQGQAAPEPVTAYLAARAGRPESALTLAGTPSSTTPSWYVIALVVLAVEALFALIAMMTPMPSVLHDVRQLVGVMAAVTLFGAAFGLQRAGAPLAIRAMTLSALMLAIAKLGCWGLLIIFATMQVLDEPSANLESDTMAMIAITVVANLFYVSLGTFLLLRPGSARALPQPIIGDKPAAGSDQPSNLDTPGVDTQDRET